MTSKHLNRAILEVVENQLRDNNPRVTRETFERLMSSGHSEKEAKEMIASVVAETIYAVMKENKPFDETEFEKRLSLLK